MIFSWVKLSGATAFFTCLLLISIPTNAQPSGINAKPDQPDPIVYERKSADFILRKYEDDIREVAKDLDIDGDGDPDIDSASPEGYEDLVNKLLDKANIVVDYNLENIARDLVSTTSNDSDTTTTTTSTSATTTTTSGTPD